jgi:hypothetical protein
LHFGGALVFGKGSTQKDKNGSETPTNQNEIVEQALDLGNFFNVGAAANLAHKNGVEFGVGADVTMNKKFNNYSGFLKVKVSL